MTDEVKNGQLQKYKSWLKWSIKSFVLSSEYLSYKTSSGNNVNIHLQNISILNESGNAFTIVDSFRQKKLFLKASSFENKTCWINAINSQKANILHCGCLKKWTNVLKGWQTRYFILFHNRLCYYLNKETLEQRRGTTYLVDKNSTVTDSVTKHGFDLMTESTVWYLKALTKEEQQVWTSKISQTICQTRLSRDVISKFGDDTSPITTLKNDALHFHKTSLSNQSISSRQEDSDQESSYRKDLECIICLELLHEPTTLICGHSFCRNCLANLWASQKSRFNCPSCRRPIGTVPAINIALQNLIPIIYENVENVRDKCENREAFDQHFCNQSLSSPHINTSNGFQFQGLRSQLIKWGLGFLFILWSLSKILYFISNSNDASETNEFDNNKDINMTNPNRFMDSRNTMIFLFIGVMHCPRLLGGYILIFNYSDIAYPLVKTISQIMNQLPSFKFHLQIIIWGAIVPYVWFIPIYLFETEYQLGLLAGILSLIECVDVVLLCKHCFTTPSHGRYQYIVSLIKQECSECWMKLIHARAIAWLPWSWVPDVIFYCVILYVVSENVSYHVARVKGFFRLRTSFVRD